jgi:hypothetical protein
MTKSGGYSLGKGKEEYTEIWDLIEAQLDKALKSTKGDQAVQLVYVWNIIAKALAFQGVDLVLRVGPDTRLLFVASCLLSFPCAQPPPHFPSYPLPSDNAAIAPDLLGRAAEAGMDPTKFGDDVMSFMTGGVSAEEMVARRKAKISSEGIKGVMKE